MPIATNRPIRRCVNWSHPCSNVWPRLLLINGTHWRQRRRGCRGRDLPIFDLHGSSCVDEPPPIFWLVFYFFPFIGTSIKFIIQLQSMGHMNLKNNTPRMHHITPFWEEKFINFLRKGTSVPPQTPPPRRLRRLDSLASSALDLRPPMFQWRWHPWRQAR